MSIVYLKSNVRDPLSTVDKLSKVKVKFNLSMGNYSCKENRKCLDSVSSDILKLKLSIISHYRSIQYFEMDEKNLMRLIYEMDEIFNFIEKTEYSLKKLMIDNSTFMSSNILDPTLKKELESNILNFAPRFAKFLEDFYAYKNGSFEELQSKKMDESLLLTCQKELNQKLIPSISLFYMYFTSFTDNLISSGFITTK